MTLPLDRLEELERLAKAATPGPWIATPDGRLWVKREGDDYGRGWRANRANDAAYVAAVNPATILDLIQALRLSEERRERAERERHISPGSMTVANVGTGNTHSRTMLGTPKQTATGCVAANYP